MELLLIVLALLLFLAFAPFRNAVDARVTEPAIEAHNPGGCGAGVVLVMLFGCAAAFVALAAAMEVSQDGAGVELFRILLGGGQ